MKLVAVCVLAMAMPLVATGPASAASLTPGGPVQFISTSTGVTIDNYVATTVGTASSGAVSADYTEYVVADSSNPYGTDDLTFLVSVGNGTAAIQGVTLGSFFANPSAVTVGYIVGPGDFGTDIPLSAQEGADGTVQFNFDGLDDIAPGTGTELMVIQTSATSLPSGNVGIISILPAATTVSPTPEPGSLVLLTTGLLGGTITAVRRRPGISMGSARA